MSFLAHLSIYLYFSLSILVSPIPTPTPYPSSSLPPSLPAPNHSLSLRFVVSSSFSFISFSPSTAFIPVFPFSGFLFLRHVFFYYYFLLHHSQLFSPRLPVPLCSSGESKWIATPGKGEEEKGRKNERKIRGERGWGERCGKRKWMDGRELK